MKVDTLKDLESIMKLCKKHGVEKINIDGIAFEIQLQDKTAASSSDDVASEQYSEDQLLNWSSMPVVV